MSKERPAACCRDELPCLAYSGTLAQWQSMYSRKTCHKDDWDRSGDSSLMCAAHSGNLEVAQYLLRIDVDLERSNNGGFTAIMIACSNGYLEIFREIMRHHPNLDIASLRGLTPLHLAVQKQNVVMVEELLPRMRKQTIDAKTLANEWTALHMAADAGNEAIVDLLLAAKADPAPHNSNGNTPDMLLTQRRDLRDLMMRIRQAQFDAL